MRGELESYEGFCEKFFDWNFHLLSGSAKRLEVVRSQQPDLADRILQILQGRNQMWGDYFKSHPEFYRSFYEAYKILHQNDPSDTFIPVTWLDGAGRF